MAVNRWFAAIILTPLAAVAAHSEPLQLKPLVPPPIPRESETRTLKLRLIEDPVFSPGPVHNSGMIAQTPVAKNATVGVGFAHGFHTPYWALRSLVGLPSSEHNPLVRAYRSFLILATTSRWMHRMERALDWICPKSVILYAEKPARAPRPA